MKNKLNAGPAQAGPVMLFASMKQIIILLAGWLWAFLPLFSQYSPDSSFGANGKMTLQPDEYSEVISMINSEDTLYVLAVSGHLDSSGFWDNDLVLLKLDESGNLIQDFGTNGIHRFDFGGMDYSAGDQLISDANGLMVLGSGYALNDPGWNPVCISRFTYHGERDSSWGMDGDLRLGFYGSQEYPNAIGTDHAGRFLLAGASLDTLHGHSEAAVVGRFLPDGKADSSFGGTGKVDLNLTDGLQSLKTAHFTGGIAYHAIELPDEKILVGGGYSNGSHLVSFLCRLHADGSIDSSFYLKGYYIMDVSPGYNNQVIELAAPYNGKVRFGISSLAMQGRDFHVGELDLATGQIATWPVDVNGQEDLLHDVVQGSDGSLLLAGSSRDPQSSSSNPDQFSFTFHTNPALMSQYTTYSAGFFTGFPCGATAATADSASLWLGGYTMLPSSGQSSIAIMKFKKQETTSRSEIESESGIRLFPVPASTYLTIISEKELIRHYEVYNAGGRQMEAVILPQSLNQVQLDIKHYPSGLYFIRISLSNDKETGKAFVVENN